MVPIYICEDQSEILMQIEKNVRNISMIEEFDFNVVLATRSPEELLCSLQEKRTQGIYFLDIEFPKEAMNGFELGKKIRKLDSRGFLIYVTTHSELLPETFAHQLEALDYILKDDPSQLNHRIKKALSTIQNLLGNELHEVREIFTVESASRILHIPVDTIEYFETTCKKHNVALITADQYVEFPGNLTQIEERLSSNFIRTHQSYLVNRSKIQSIDKRHRMILLKSGGTCLVSRSKLKELKKLF
ncbi:LytTR family DNA-binding domain-containing protein [Enterococcus sp.]|uniref:LytR/AlgR family response regulator transcription factor n=1 Tax=Enterococcus sp. TaxID=35783 RepID=UPI00290E4580|nr:LytTR family DNA-binding domain-containing protein [Enterococcus sp.]MDU5334640.1 LytTR family DNA-binding domain-containing protein [Enterococcus sp.]